MISWVWNRKRKYMAKTKPFSHINEKNKTRTKENPASNAFRCLYHSIVVAAISEIVSHQNAIFLNQNSEFLGPYVKYAVLTISTLELTVYFQSRPYRFKDRILLCHLFNFCRKKILGKKFRMKMVFICWN